MNSNIYYIFKKEKYFGKKLRTNKVVPIENNQIQYIEIVLFNK